MDFNQLVRYLFWIVLALIAFVYFTGSTGLAKTLFSGSNSILMTVTGQTKTGFKAYPGKG